MCWDGIEGLFSLNGLHLKVPFKTVTVDNLKYLFLFLFICVEVLQPSQPNGVMSSAVSLPNHTFTGQA